MAQPAEQLDRGPDAAPLYRQVTHRLVTMAQGMQSGDRFPTDRELTELFGVSRITVHQAVKDLVRFGYLLRIQGKGTFVSRPKLERDEPRLNSFSEDMRAMGYRPGAKLLTHQVSAPDDLVREKLALDADEQTLYLERLMLADDEPIAVLYTHLPKRLCLNFDDWFTPEALDDASLYKLLESKCGYQLVEADETIEAIPADEKEAALLEVDAGSPLLWFERLTYLDSGIPIEFSQFMYRAERYKLVIRAKRHPD